jgi:hypothetical protein
MIVFPLLLVKVLSRRLISSRSEENEASKVRLGSCEVFSRDNKMTCHSGLSKR